MTRPRRLTASEMHMRILALRDLAANNRPVRSGEALLLVSYADDLLGDLAERVKAKAEREASNA